MKTGCVIINSTDIYAAFGVYVTRGSYRSLIQWPSLKDIDKNDWMESDGEEPDLSALPLAPRSFTLQFAVRRGGDYEGFCDWLEAQHTLAVNVAEIGLSFYLRAVSYPSLDYALDDLSLFSVAFEEDAIDYHEISSPSPAVVFGPSSNQYLLDETSLAAYGVQVVKGTLTSVAKRPDIKQYLKRESKYKNGQTYDLNPLLWDSGAGQWARAVTEGPAKHSAREITLKCHTSGNTAAQCWANYFGFFNALVALQSGGDAVLAGAHRLDVRDLGVTLQVYYTRQSVGAFYPEAGHYWVDFDVTLQVIGGLNDKLLLATESGILVVTEDGIYNIQI